MARQSLRDGLPPVADLLGGRIRRHDGGGDHLGSAPWPLSRRPRGGRLARVRDGPFLPRLPRGLLDLLHLPRPRGRCRAGRPRARGIEVRRLLAERALRGVRRGSDPLPPPRHRLAQAGVPAPGARRRDGAVARPQTGIRSARDPQSREAGLVTALRRELESAGLEIAGDGERIHVVPGDVASLARAVARIRRAGARIGVRGDGDGARTGAEAILDLRKLNRVIAIDAATGIARVEAGCRVRDLEAAVQRASATLGPLLPSVRAGSVGSWLAGPTRGERGIPGARRETAALAVSVILPDGRIAESRAAPRSATGPDLDHLALGGEGHLFVVAGAVIRLFPSAPSCAAAFLAPSLEDAVEAVARLCRDRLAPARAVVRPGGGGALLAFCWEGPLCGALHRERAIRSLDRKGWPLAADVDPADALEALPRADCVEVDATWESLAR